MKKVGTRVTALQSMDATTVYLYGDGVYEGEFPCPALNGRANPRILLDNGSVVWGMQCWWGAEAAVKSRFGERKIVEVKPLTMDEITGGAA